MDLSSRIRGAALVEFAEKGVRFTMDDLSRRLGISKKTLYAQVRDKEGILASLIEDAFTSIKEQERGIVGDAALDPVEKLRRVIGIMPSLGSTLDYRRVKEIARQYPELYARIAAHIESDWEVTLALYEAAARKGLLRRVDTGVLRELLFATMEQLLRDDFLERSGLSYDEAIRGMLDMLFEGLLARGKAEPRAPERAGSRRK